MRTSLNLRTKILGITVGLTLALGLLVMAFVQTALRQKLTAELQKRGLIIAGNVVEKSVNEIAEILLFNADMRKSNAD